MSALKSTSSLGSHECLDVANMFCTEMAIMQTIDVADFRIYETI